MGPTDSTFLYCAHDHRYDFGEICVLPYSLPISMLCIYSSSYPVVFVFSMFSSIVLECEKQRQIDELILDYFS